MHVDEGRGSPSGRLQRKLEPTDVIPSSSRAKKLAFLYQNFVFEQTKKWTFFVNRTEKYKLLVVPFK